MLKETLNNKQFLKKVSELSIQKLKLGWELETNIELSQQNQHLEKKKGFVQPQEVLFVATIFEKATNSTNHILSLLNLLSLSCLCFEKITSKLLRKVSYLTY